MRQYSICKISYLVPTYAHFHINLKIWKIDYSKFNTCSNYYKISVIEGKVDLCIPSLSHPSISNTSNLFDKSDTAFRRKTQMH